MLLSFIPLFTAADALYALLIVLGFTTGIKRIRQHRMLGYEILTDLWSSLGFTVLGKGVFIVLNILELHYLVTGELIVLLQSIRILLMGERRQIVGVIESEAIVIFHIGILMFVWLTVVITLLVLINRYAILAVVCALLLNLTCARLTFTQEPRIAYSPVKGGLGAV